jgi:threonine/homoserine/homoserine lactone efflux protein
MLGVMLGLIILAMTSTFGISVSKHASKSLDDLITVPIVEEGGIAS